VTGGTGQSSTASEAPRRFSAGVPVLRRWSGGKARAGITVVGPIWPEGAWDGRSTARWRVSAAGDRWRGMPCAIGEGDGCVVFVREW
jgi:hypothetical protein